MWVGGVPSHLKLNFAVAVLVVHYLTFMLVGCRVLEDLGVVRVASWLSAELEVVRDRR